MTPTPPHPSRTVAQKMGITPGSRALVWDAPASALSAMSLPDLDLVDRLEGEPVGATTVEFDYVHLFVTSRDDMRTRFPQARDALAERGKLWVSWPKGGALGTDLTMRVVIALGYDCDMVESTCLRIDDVWAGLKFTRPKPGKQYANSYGTLPGQRC